MKPLRTQPFFQYATERLPADSNLHQAIAEYLGMRLHKDPHLHVKVWEACIDELVAGMRIDVKTKQQKGRYRTIGAKVPTTTVNDLIYLFQVATSRGWNHVYFTQDQDASWCNMSYYQDPYWHKLTVDQATRKQLEDILDGTES